MNVLVVGGGLAGLSVATLLTRFGVEVTTLTPEFGGMMSNVNVANPYGEGVFKFDFRLNKSVKEGAFHKLVRGVEGVVEHEKNDYYLEMPYPETATWVKNPVHKNTKQLVFDVSVQPEEDPHEDKTLASYAIRNYGEEFYTQWFEPFFQRKFSTYPDHLDSDWIESEMEEDFIYVPGHSVVRTMLASLLEYSKGSWIWVNGILRKLWRDKSGWYAVGFSGSSVMNIGPFDAVVSTIGIQELVNSLERFGSILVPPTIWNNIISCGVMMKGEYHGRDFSWLYPDVSLRAHRVSMPSRLSPELAPEGQDSLLIEFPTFDQLEQNVIESLSMDVETVLKLLDIKASSTVWVANKGYPIPTLDVRSNLAETKRQLARSNIYSTGHWGSHALLSNEHVLGEALRTVNHLMSGEEESEYLWSIDRYPYYEEKKYDN